MSKNDLRAFKSVQNTTTTSPNAVFVGFGIIERADGDSHRSVGFASVSAVFYPASKATERVMRATDGMMEETTKWMERSRAARSTKGSRRR